MSSRAGARRRREIGLAYLLLAPTLLLLLAVLAYPLAWEVWTSLTDLSPLPRRAAFVGLENYRGPSTIRVLAPATAPRLLRGDHRRQARAGAGVRPPARPAVARSHDRLPGCLPPLGVPRRVGVIAWYWMLNPPLTTSYSVAAGQLKRSSTRSAAAPTLSQRGPLQYLARLLLHRGVPPGRAQRDPHRAPRVRAPRHRERVAALLARHHAPAPPVPRAGRVPLLHHRLRRPRQCLDADGRADRLPDRRNPCLLARHPRAGSSVRRPPVALAGALLLAVVLVVLFRWFDRGEEPARPRESSSPARGPRGPAAPRGRVRPLPDLLRHRPVAQDSAGGRVRQPPHVRRPTFENYTELFARAGAGLVRAALPRVPFLLWLLNPRRPAAGGRPHPRGRRRSPPTRSGAFARPAGAGGGGSSSPPTWSPRPSCSSPCTRWSSRWGWTTAFSPSS